MKLALKLAFPLLSSALVLLAFACLQPARNIYSCDPEANDGSNGCLEGEVCRSDGICRSATDDDGGTDDGGTDAGAPDGSVPDGGEPDGSAPDGGDDGGSDGGPDLCAAVTCTNPTPVCNPVDGSCGGCGSDAECTDPGLGLACRVDGHCVECTASTPHCDLSGNGDICDSTRNLCVECTTPQDCSGSLNGEVCDLALGVCVECEAASDCDFSQVGPICHSTNQVCVECEGDADCDFPAGETCDANVCGFSGADGGVADGGDDGGTDDGGTDGGERFDGGNNPTCTDEITHTDCGPSYPQAPYCESGICVECLAPTDCQNGETSCVGVGVCSECANDFECPDPAMNYCNFAVGRCVTCKNSSPDCLAGAWDICRWDGVCVECLSDAECLGVRTGVCDTVLGNCI